MSPWFEKQTKKSEKEPRNFSMHARAEKECAKPRAILVHEPAWRSNGWLLNLDTIYRALVHSVSSFVSVISAELSLKS